MAKARKLNMKQQMTLSTKVLEAIKLAFPDAIVAGGAPRDWDHGKRANDIDVFAQLFIPAMASSIIDRVKEIMTLKGITVDSIYDTVDYLYDGAEGDISMVINIIVKGQKFQLILLNEVNVHTYTSEFPFALSKITWDGRYFNEHDDYTFAKFTKWTCIDQRGQNKAHVAKQMDIARDLGYVMAYDMSAIMRNMAHSIRDGRIVKSAPQMSEEVPF